MSEPTPQLPATPNDADPAPGETLDYNAINQEILEETDARVGAATHMFFFLSALMCFAFGWWSYVSTLDIVSNTDGEVIPSSQVKQIQHLEGGIVQRILVKEGDAVTKGQPVVELESTSSGADVTELNVRIASLKVELIRLQTEIEDKETIVFPPEMVSAQPKLTAQTRSLFLARRTRLKNSLNGQREIIEQRKQDINEVKTRMKNAKKRRELLDEQVRISKKLLVADITNRYNHLELLKEANTIQSSIDEDMVLISKTEAGLKEAQSQLSSIQSTYNEEVRTGLEEAQRQLDEFTARHGKYADSLDRTILRAPVDGIVKTMNVATRGGVIKPGDTVLEIVPGGDVLVVEARLPVTDIGYITIGQEAKVRLASADAQKYGAMDGKVTGISPDTVETEEGAPYYKVRIETGKTQFEKDGDTYRLFPGMIVQVGIQTGQRTILEYLFAPFLTSMDLALTER